jgi:hypothetical protein
MLFDDLMTAYFLLKYSPHLKSNISDFYNNHTGKNLLESLTTTIFDRVFCKIFML